MPIDPVAESEISIAPDAGRISRGAVRIAKALGRMSVRTLVLTTALAGILLTLPALWTGFAQDDHFFLMVFKGSPGFEVVDLSPLETFSFSKGDPAQRAELLERGLLPWWAAENWKLNFWRPLSSLSTWIDYLIVGETAWIMHLHSLLLYGVLIAIAAVLYRRWIAPHWAAGVAALAFAMDSGHAIPVTWLAMRNAVLAMLFGLLVLAAHDRWRREGAEGRRGLIHAALAIVWLALALLSGESAVAVGGYLAAYALFLDPIHRTEGGSRSWIVRSAWAFVALLPYLAVVVVWRGVYSGLGYGSEGSGLYIDPVADPVEFMLQLPANLAVLLLGMLALPDAALWALGPAPVAAAQLTAAVVFLIVFGWAIVPLLRKNAVARFMLVGSLLAAVPGCATLPMDRLMMYASFGGLGLVALLLADMAGAEDRDGWRGRVRSPLAILLIVSHFIVAPIGLITGTQHLPIMNRVLSGSNPSILLELPAATRVVAINTPNDLQGASLPIHRSSRNEPLVQHWWWLYSGTNDMTVERVGEGSLVLRPEGGYFTTPWTRIFRMTAADPIAAGDTFALEGLQISVIAVTPEGAPLEVRFDFDMPLEDPSLHFVTWQNGAYVPFAVPAIGATVQVPGVRMAKLIPVALGLE